MSACHTVLHHLHRAKDDGHAAVFIVSYYVIHLSFSRLYSAVGSVQGKQNVRIKTSTFDIRSIGLTFLIKNIMVRE